MWKLRKAKDYFHTEHVDGEMKDFISKNTLKGFLERLSLSEEWLLKQLLGDSYVVKAAAVNVKVSAKKTNSKADNYFGDLYVVQNTKNGKVSIKLYSLKENRFVWSVDAVSNLDGYLDLKCNTHILHQGDSIYTFKFPDKKERILFRDSLNKFLYFENAKK